MDVTMKNNKRFLFLFMLLAVSACLAVWMSAVRINYITAVSENGVWDLRGVNFGTESIRLSGDVEYIPNALLTPEEFDASDNIVRGEIPERVTYLTSRVRLLVQQNGGAVFPEDARYLEIAGFSADFGSRIFLNGKWLTDVGRPADNKADNIPSERFIRFTALPENGVIEIVQQTSNFVFRTNTSHTGWTIGLPKTVDRWVWGFSYSFAIGMGVYLTLFFAHLLLFILLPSYKANLWLAALCAAMFIRTGILSVRPLVVITQMDWALALRIEYMTLLCGLVFITKAYSIIFPGVLRKNLCNLIYAISGGFLLLFIFADTLFMSRSIIYCEIVACIWAVYAVAYIIRKLPQTDAKQKILIIGLGIIMAAMIWDTVYHTIDLPFFSNSMMETAVTAFSLFQMTAMFLGTMEEAAAAREAEQKLSAENAALDRMNRMKTDLMTTISHEARTPLAVLASYAGLVSMGLQEKGLDEQAVADLDKIVYEAKRVADLIDSMKKITMNSAETAARIRLDMRELIEQTAGLYRPILERAGIKIYVSLDGELHINGKPDEMTQVLFNILQNAKEHTEQGSISVTAKRKDGLITISVSDTGTGVVPEILANIFERGIKTGGGMGIGLAICKEITEAHGGTIRIENRKPAEDGSAGNTPVSLDSAAGAVVTLTLPEYREGSDYGE